MTASLEIESNVSGTHESGTCEGIKKVVSSAAGAMKKNGTAKSMTTRSSDGKDDEEEDEESAAGSSDAEDVEEEDEESAAESFFTSKDDASTDSENSIESGKEMNNVDPVSLGFEIGAHMCKEGYQAKGFNEVVMEAVRLSVQKVNLFVIYPHLFVYFKIFMLNTITISILRFGLLLHVL